MWRCSSTRSSTPTYAGSIARGTRLPVYVRAFNRGIVNPLQCFDRSQVRRHELLDADNGLGVIIGQRAMDRAVELAGDHGMGVVAVRNSNHAGMLATHVERAAARGMIGFFTSNGPAIMPPPGGSSPARQRALRLGIPTESGRPLILDMACSSVARGKIRLYAGRDEPLPSGWALDADRSRDHRSPRGAEGRGATDGFIQGIWDRVRERDPRRGACRRVSRPTCRETS